MKKIYTLIIIILFSLGNIYSQTPLTTAVDFTVTDIYGTQHNLFSYLNNNKYVCLDFFYKDCPACAATAPYYQQTFTNFGCNTGNVIFIALSSVDNQATLLAYSQTNNYSYPMVEVGQGAPINQTYGITATPTYILIAPNKTIVEQDMWPVNSAQDLINPITSNGGTAKTCVAGINENNKNIYEFSVYPNPTSDFIKIEYVSEKTANYNIEIYNLLGELIKQIPATSNNLGVLSKTIDLKSFNNGNYFIKLLSENQIIAVEKIILLK